MEFEFHEPAAVRKLPPLPTIPDILGAKNDVRRRVNLVTAGHRTRGTARVLTMISRFVAFGLRGFDRRARFQQRPFFADAGAAVDAMPRGL